MILGITGTNGSGKGAVVDYLVEERDFAHFSVRDFIVEEVKRRGLPLDRIHIGETGTGLRQEHGPEYFVRTFLAKAQEINAKDAVIESIRTIAEARFLQEQGGLLIAVDAPLELRYARVIPRGTVTDQVSLEEFRAQEDREYRPLDPNDPVQMNVLGVMEIADVTIENDGTLEELHAKIDALLAARAS